MLQMESSIGHTLWRLLGNDLYAQETYVERLLSASLLFATFRHNIHT